MNDNPFSKTFMVYPIKVSTPPPPSYLISAQLCFFKKPSWLCTQGWSIPYTQWPWYTGFTIHLGAHENVLISCNIRKVSNMSLDYIHLHTITLKQKEKNEREKRGGGGGRGKERNWWKQVIVKTKMFRVHKGHNAAQPPSSPIPFPGYLPPII